ncbi:phosphoethanolamine transferase [Pedobacter frigoris]|uniref:phosphoethanolamine transferase n=1 Tax=Pedobacter frigoris TaxID=2571272 RepID=UPI00292E9866|nr:sulfatase-like hydrolase/transferase [Pedobacter frigoris]
MLFILYYPLVLITPITVFYILTYGVTVNSDTYWLIFNTTFSESHELLKGFYLYGVLIFFTITLLYYFLLKKIPAKISFRSSLCVSLFGTLLFLIIPFFSNSHSLGYFTKIKGNLSWAWPSSNYYALKTVKSNFSTIHDFDTRTKDFKFNAIQQINIEDRQIYLLVIGESSRFYNWGINGYSRDTSPKLDKRGNQIISFTNVISGGYITQLAVPMLISQATPQNFSIHLERKSIVSIFKEAGFKTYWISNNVDNGYIFIHSKESDVVKYELSDYKASKNVKTDMDLMKTLSSILSKKEKKTFIVLHTLGSHYDYDARYTTDFKKFKPTASDVNATATDYKKKDAIINSYDNSILFSDAVLDSTISLIARENAVSYVNYISDHGENLFDDTNLLSQHGSPTPTKYVAKVPMFFWASEKYQNLFGQKYRTLYNQRHAPTGSNNIFYTMLDLCGISFPEISYQKSLANEKYIQEKRYILGANNKFFLFDETKQDIVH